MCLITLKIQNMIYITKRAFTLVELIVVITILAVLATVGFISMTGYSQNSRDSVRLSDIKSITKTFEIQKTKDVKLPLPEYKIDIIADGNIIQYQWHLSEQILANNNIHGGWKDNLTGEYFWYSVNPQQNKFQIITFLENQKENVYTSKVFADNSNKYIQTWWNGLNILLTPTTKEVLSSKNSWNINLNTDTSQYALVTPNNNSITWDINYIYSKFEHIFKKDVSCKSILYHGLSKGDWIYSINPSWIEGEQFNVYCDMSTNGWGWTVIATSFANNNWDTSKPFHLDYATVTNIWIWDLDDLNSNYFISMEKYNKIANINSQKEYIWLARSRFESDPWVETIHYNKHFIWNESQQYTWFGERVKWSYVAYRNSPLSTYDNDNDTSVNNCSQAYWSFGWYTSCHAAHFWSTTNDRSTCGVYPEERYNYGWGHYCEETNNYGPDAWWAYNTWHSLKIMLR